MGGSNYNHVSISKKKHSSCNVDNRGSPSRSRDTAKEAQARDSITCIQELK